MSSIGPPPRLKKNSGLGCQCSIPCAAGDRPTDAPRVDCVATGLVPGAEKGVGRTANAHTLRCGSEHQRLSLRVTGYKRLLRIDMLAGFDNLHADRCVGQWDGKID